MVEPICVPHSWFAVETTTEQKYCAMCGKFDLLLNIVRQDCDGEGQISSTVLLSVCESDAEDLKDGLACALEK